MNEQQRQRKQEAITEFRYALVAELANPYLNTSQVSQLVRQKAAQEHEVPYLGKRKLSEACIRKWLYAYRKHGKAALEPKMRSDAGRCRSLSEAETALLTAELEKHPRLAATTVLARLKREGKITAEISSSSLSRLICATGLSRRQRLHAAEDQKQLKFEFFSPLECVQADCMYTIAVAEESGRRRKAILLAFIDDATRRILYTHFAFSERSLDFEEGIKHILSAHGRIGRLYVDNGANFVSSQTRRITDSLGLLLIHSRPYTPRGRGKIERFFRTARGQFFRTLDPESVAGLADLQVRFRSWVESEYHRNPHRGLHGLTPLDQWLAKASHIIALDQTIDLDRTFCHQISRKVYRDSTVTLDGVLYEVPSSLIGERITLRFDPSIPAQRRQMTIILDGTECGTARIVDSYANTRVRRTNLHKDLSAEQRQQPQQPTNLRPPSATDSSLAASAMPFVTPELQPEDENE
jgi:transposase InsO family protein